MFTFSVVGLDQIDGTRSAATERPGPREFHRSYSKADWGLAGRHPPNLSTVTVATGLIPFSCLRVGIEQSEGFRMNLVLNNEGKEGDHAT